MNLLKRFQAQDQDTIWSFLREINEQKQTFMYECRSLRYAFKNNGVYLFAKGTEAVVLVVDELQYYLDELIDEQPMDGWDPLWFSESSHRPSPVFRLRQVMKLLSDGCNKAEKPVPRLMGMLLTPSRLVNSEDYEDCFADWKVKVIDSLDPEKIPLRLPVALQVGDGMELIEATERAYDDASHHLPEVSLEWVPESGKKKTQQPSPKQRDAAAPAQDESSDDDSFQQAMEELFGPLPEDDVLPLGEPLSLDSGTPTAEEQPESEEDAFFEEFENHLDAVREDLNMQYPEASGVCSVPSRLDVRHPTLHPDEEFDGLVGCRQIREQIAQLTILSKYNLRRMQLEPRARHHDITLHALFTGNPGVGKSTVCRLYGSLLRQAGVLKYGHVIVCDRSTFVGTHWGDEEKNVRAALQMARGGVLMVDEAYQLLGDLHPTDPGRLVLPLMMNVLADPAWSDVAVVLCGYPEPMQRLLQQNIGLLSRFPNHFTFPDFTVEELEQITLNHVTSYGYHFSRAAWAKYRWFLREAYDQRNERWSNARFVVNWLNHIYMHHAMRCERENLTSLRKLHALTQEDICIPPADH